MVEGLEYRRPREFFCASGGGLFGWRFFMWGMFNCIPGYEFSPTEAAESSPSTSRCLDEAAALFERCGEYENGKDEL